MTVAAINEADIRDALDAKARPAIRSHLGDIELESVDDTGVVHVSFGGVCTRCSYRKLTLLGLVLAAVADIDGVTGVAADGVPVTAAETRKFLNILKP